MSEIVCIALAKGTCSVLAPEGTEASQLGESYPQHEGYSVAEIASCCGLEAATRVMQAELKASASGSGYYGVQIARDKAARREIRRFEWYQVGGATYRVESNGADRPTVVEMASPRGYGQPIKFFPRRLDWKSGRPRPTDLSSSTTASAAPWPIRARMTSRCALRREVIRLSEAGDRSRSRHLQEENQQRQFLGILWYMA
jgi:hypothetical protein